MMNPDYFQQLVDIARKLNDSHLEDVALEAHFHALIRHQQSFRFTFGKYALTDMDDKEEKGTITCGRTIYSEQEKLLQVERQGENVEKCVTVMESWAENPIQMDYWIPATSLCGTIAAITR
ncbi:hypothetical protein PI126_g12352 [Phytophthora idaei]|nr:hypothetical protein PI126_g12352 [Phytophthora idaei]